jgi:hypothetical protein
MAEADRHAGFNFGRYRNIGGYDFVIAIPKTSLEIAPETVEDAGYNAVEEAAPPAMQCRNPMRHIGLRATAEITRLWRRPPVEYGSAGVPVAHQEAEAELYRFGLVFSRI